MKVAKPIRRFLKAADKHKPQILTALGISGYLSSIVMAVKETPKALQLIEDAKDEDGNITKKEAAKASWKCYIPTAIVAGASTACIIGSTAISQKRNAALATAYAAALTSAREYKEKVLEVVGTETEQKIRSKVDEEKLKKNPITQNEVLRSKEGDDLIYDPWSGRYFRSSIDEIKGIMNDLNYEMLNHDVVYLNDFYDMIGLDRTRNGGDYGWDINRTGPVKPFCTTQLADNNRPCIVLGFDQEPRIGV